MRETLIDGVASAAIAPAVMDLRRYARSKISRVEFL